MEDKRTSLLDAINAAFRRRKYYLNSKVRYFTKVSSRQKHISMPMGLEAKLTRKQKQYIDELVANYGYSPQMSIPDHQEEK